LPTDITPPIVVDLGRTRREQIERLCHGGASRLAGDIEEALGRVRSNAAVARANRIFVPVVVVYTPAAGEDDDQD
jgi:hypothetical protein